MDEKIKITAFNFLDDGDLENLFMLIKPFLAEQDADALYLYSCFSLTDWEESDEEFENRSLDLLSLAAKKGSPEALYKLGTLYEVGDGVVKDPLKSSMLFKNAAEKGHARAKLSYGLDLFYGSNGIPRDKSLGLSFIKQAVDEEVEGAKKTLNNLQKLT